MLINLRVWAAKRPLLVATLLLLIALAYFLLPTLLTEASGLFGHGKQQQGASEFATNLWSEIALSGVLVLVVISIGWARETGLAAMPRWRACLFTLPYIAFVVFIVVVAFGSVLLKSEGFALTVAEWRVVAIASFVALIVGLFEELLFRGVLLHALRSRMGGVSAVLVSAVIFGAFHFVNWISGQPLDLTVLQVVGAAGGGVFYGALVLWTKSLWPSILMHGLWDAGVTLNQTVLTAGGIVTADDNVAFNPLSALLSPELVYGLILLVVWALWNRYQSKRSDFVTK